MHQSTERIDSCSKLSETLHEKSVFIFDWDGTIFDSMKIKTQNFKDAVCAVFPAQKNMQNAVVKTYQKFSGHPREYIFKKILEILGKDHNPESYIKFNNIFGGLNQISLVRAKPFPDAIELIEKLIEARHQIYISSSVPPDELSMLVSRVLPGDIRKGISAILGSAGDFVKGAAHIQSILEKTGLEPSAMLVIGDDMADYELTVAVGVDCILVDRSGRLSRRGVSVVSDLKQIREGLVK